MVASHSFPDIAALKSALRAQASAARAALDPALGEALAAHLLREAELPAGAAIAGVWPLPGEIDLRPLLTTLHERHHPILLPETTRRGERLIFRHWHPGSAMLAGRFGTSHPDGREGSPEVLLVPLLAFDRQGNRLGYGGGYYDRTLAALPNAVAIGFGFAAQEVASVPVDATDHRLAAIVTERGFFRIPPASR